MPIPGQTISIRDPGLGITEPNTTVPIVMGCASTGTVNTVYTITNKNQATSDFGQGPLPECLCHMLDIAGGPIYAVRTTGGTAGSCGAVTAVRVGVSTGTVTVAGQIPFDAYEVQIEITATGTLGAGKFKFSLDDGRTWSAEYTIPGGPGTFVIPSTNITATFVPGAGPTFFEDGDLHWFDCVAPLYTTANLSSAFTAAMAAGSAYEYAFVVLTGCSASAADAATMFATAETNMASMAVGYRYARCLMDFGSKDTTGNVVTSRATVDDRRVATVYGLNDCASSKPFEGWGTPLFPAVYNFAARAHKSLISTDLSRVADGSADGVVACNYDEYISGALDTSHVGTMRTWPGRTGYYFTNCWLASPAGSDFRYWQHGRIMDVATRRVVREQQLFIGIGVRTNATTGTIDERDAARLETRVEEPLRQDLTQPTNAEGTQGHVSDLAYQIDRTNNVLSTETLLSEIAIRPLGYVKWITSYIGFDLSAGASE